MTKLDEAAEEYQRTNKYDRPSIQDIFKDGAAYGAREERERIFEILRSDPNNGDVWALWLAEELGKV